MTALLARDEEEGREPDVTLSTTSLLALFLGLVLVCGVFFGFGYSMGRRSGLSLPSGAATANTADGSVAAAEQSSKPPVVDTQSAPNDSAPNDLPVIDRPSSTATDEAPTADAQSSSPAPKDTGTPDRVVEQLRPAAPAAVTLPAVEKPTPPPAKVAKPQAQAAAGQMAKANTARPNLKQPMVQVAAVVHEEDADALVAALRKHGFSAVVRTEPQDKLLHVQVGPFAGREQANAMRQKLLSDGYAAIIKQ